MSLRWTCHTSRSGKFSPRVSVSTPVPWKFARHILHRQLLIDCQSGLRDHEHCGACVFTQRVHTEHARRVWSNIHDVRSAEEHVTLLASICDHPASRKVNLQKLSVHARCAGTTIPCSRRTRCSARGEQECRENKERCRSHARSIRQRRERRRQASPAWRRHLAEKIAHERKTGGLSFVVSGNQSFSIYFTLVFVVPRPKLPHSQGSSLRRGLIAGKR